MKYYKILDEDGNVLSLEERSSISTDEKMIEIEQEEYLILLSEKEKEWENADTEPSYIEQLENENAALLYQVLTGEEFTNA